jgi:drug/metabolite transporter (DMT)-like permease
MVPAFFWGTTYAVTQYTVPDWPPLLLGFVRALPAGLLLFALKPVIPARHQWQPILILSVINIGAFFAMIFQWLWFKKRPSMVQVVSGGILVAFAWFLFDPSQLSLSVVGLVAMFCAICCIVIGSMLTQNLSKDMHWWGVLSWQLIIGGVVLGLVTGLQFWVDPATYQAVLSNDISIRNWAGITWIVLLNTALAYGMYIWLIRKMTVVEFTFSGIANPVAGITGGVLLMNESYSAAQIGLMMGMIAASLLPNFINLWRTKRRIKASAVKTENTQDNVPVTD